VLRNRGPIGLLCLLLGALLHLLMSALLLGAPAAAQQDGPVLRLLVLGSDPGPIVPDQTRGVDDAAVPTLASPAGRSVTAGFIGERIDDALLADIRDALAAYYEELGRPFVDIAIPVQDVADGTLRVNVIETRRGRILVNGNRWFDAGQYEAAVRTQPGDPIDISGLAADAEWINRIEQRHATISLRPTDEPLVYDVAINVRDRPPLALTLAGDNSGTTDTGLYRIGAGVDWTNAFWRGDDLSYGFLTDSGGLRLLQHAVSYTTWLPWRDSITVSGVVANIKGLATAASNFSSLNGRTEIVSWRYSMALPRTPDFVQRIEFGYDFKSTNTNVLSGGASVFPTTSELNQFSISYLARRRDSRGATGLDVTLAGSPGHLTPRDTGTAFAAQQPGASATYLYARFGFERLTELPHDFTWSARLTAQYSGENLLPSEQLVFGGSQSIRGFAELGATRDSGVVMQHELRLPPVSLPTRPDAAGVVPFVFVDMGVGRNHLDPAGVRRSWIEQVSVGPGLTWSFLPAAALRLSWGFPLIRNGHTGPFLGPQFGTQITF
jgi:hemolysin activation/secretion protein